MRRFPLMVWVLAALLVGALSGYGAGVWSERARASRPDAAHAGAPHFGVLDSATESRGDHTHAPPRASADLDVRSDRADRDAAAGASRQDAGHPSSEVAAAQVPGRGAPRPISVAGERRIEAVIAEARTHSTDFDDRQTLLEHEARDTTSAAAAEAQLATILRDYSAGHSGLELAPPRCSDTVCALTATALPGLGTDAPNANAQALFSRLMSDPRFQAAFSDPSMLVTSRDDAVVYVATVLRTPGAG